MAVSAAKGEADKDRLVNLSARANSVLGETTLITGFVVAPGPSKSVLVRAVGPSLSAFGLTGLLSNPTVTLRDSAGAVVAQNDNWDPVTGVQFAAVGAFTLPAGSLDAALHAELAPGAYTVEISGGSGLVIAEVYDVSGQARLNNLSARGFTDAGASVLIGGIVNSNTLARRRVLIRGAGPSLSLFGIKGYVADPILDLYDGDDKLVASNDNWDSSLASAFSSAGAFAFPEGSRDAALVVELGNGPYTVHLRGASGSSGVGLLEVYDLTTPNAVFLSLKVDTLLTSYGKVPAGITITRSGDLSGRLTVPLSVSGTAVPGVEYDALPASVTFEPGATSASLQIQALASPVSFTHTVSVSVSPTADYAITGADRAECVVQSGDSTLFLSTLRPEALSATTTASGYSVVRLSGDEQYLTIALSFSNLSSEETSAYLRVVLENGLEAELLKLPIGQVDSYLWRIGDVGSITASEIVSAIKAGRVSVQVRTSSFPGGELSGAYAKADGSTSFTPPPAPPELPSGLPTPRDASRFLTQATFGATQAEIDALTQNGFQAWFDEQVAKTPSLHRTGTMEDFALYPATATSTAPNALNRLSAWWKIAFKGEDQLRQRVAFALSELLVVSDKADALAAHQEATAAYYDLLVQNAFGTYRDLLEKVSTSPIMGVYLSSLRNAKATSATSAQPDENYAREVMQLFTVGLWELQPDGSLKLDSDGAPIPTYDQSTVTETAKVFTGWGYYSSLANPSFRGSTSDFFNPMMQYPAFHDTSAKTIIRGQVLPAGQTGEQDLKDTLDALVNHPSAPPFICHKLIQRLVTSNPSPGYVYRVAKVFEDDGAGVRGNLLAVVKAILLDYEARSLDVLANAGQGKLKEPILRWTQLTRAFNGTSSTGRYAFGNADNEFGQGPLRSPTVFNFFEPTYVPRGVMAAAGITGPEFQILNSSTAIYTPNRFFNSIYTTTATVLYDYSAYVPLDATPAALVDALDLVLCQGGTSVTQKALIVNALVAVKNVSSAVERVRMAAYLLSTTPTGAVQH